MNRRELTIPKKLENILNKDRETALEVNNILLKIGNILSDNDLEFFPEYTDHGIDHVQQVLDSASLIISDKTYKVLEPNDVAVLVIAICLHDIAMHLSYDGFNEILNGKYDKNTIADFNDKKWSSIWENYLDEVKRLDSNQLYKIFGNDKSILQISSLNNPLELNKADRLLIGEFVRRHHPRMAHEIAISGGIYGKEELSLKSNKDNIKNDYIRNLAGLVARSHGLDIRKTFNYLKTLSPQDWKRPYGINAIFLMVIIRIADYFQIQSNRTNLERVKLKRFISPVSDLEHRKHLSTLFINTHSTDLEALTVEVNPISSKTFLSVKSLLDDIQKELDISWAVLGEVYGSNSNYTIKFRRITSNLDFPEAYNSYHFIPQKVKFDSSNELPKLLIAPLYSNEPTYGVRELLQNAIDACNERQDSERNEKEKYEAAVKISIDEYNGKHTFKIEDNGKGMTFEEIKGYFLKIGSSFRNSREWKELHLDEQNHSRVNRVGRFGVGILAAFLLGDFIFITTRSKKDKSGYKFKTSLDEEQIEVLKVDDIAFGTTIEIDLTEEVVSKLSTRTKLESLLYTFHVTNSMFEYHVDWDQWYKLDYPIVSYKFLDNDWYNIEDRVINNKLDWNYFETENFGGVYWKYITDVFTNLLGFESEDNYFNRQQTGKIICNGFILPDDYKISNMGFDSYSSRFSSVLPTLLIEDPDNKLDISLDRRRVNSLLPFGSDLFLELAKSFIKQLILSDIFSPFEENKFNLNSYNNVIHDFFGEVRILYHEDGFFLELPYFTNLANKLRLKNVELGVGRSAHDKGKKNVIEFNSEVDLSEYVFSFDDNSDFEGVINSAMTDFSNKFDDNSNNVIEQSFESENYHSEDINNLITQDNQDTIIEPYINYINFERISVHTFDYPISEDGIEKFKSYADENIHTDWFIYKKNIDSTYVFNFQNESFSLLNYITEKERISNFSRQHNDINIILEQYFNGKLFIPYDKKIRLEMYSDLIKSIKIDFDQIELVQ